MKKHNHILTRRSGVVFFITSVLIAVSLACSFASDLMADPTPTATIPPSPTLAPPPTVLYSEDFSDPYSGWLTGTPPDNLESTFAYLDGEYVMTREGGSDNVNWAFASQNFYDSVLSVDVRHIAGDTNLTGPVIFWRISLNRDSFYWLLVYGNGQYSVQKVSNGVSSMIHQWEFNPAIKRGQKVNHIDIKSVGDVNTIYINGIDVLTFTDTGSVHGDFALGVTSAVQSGGEVAFDNVIVYSPENWTPTQGQ